MSSDDISRHTIRRLISDHREGGAVPVTELVALIQKKAPEPPKGAEDMQFVLRLYDGYEHRWFDHGKPSSWDDALEQWNKETDSGMERASYGDGQYFDIFPADTRMIVNSFSD